MRNLFLTFASLSILFSATVTHAEDVAEVKITADKIQFAFDLKEFTVKPGQTVKVTLVNPSDSVTRQPHNLLIVKPGRKDVVGMAANAAMTDPEFMTSKQAIPESEDILFHTKLVQAGEEDTIEFTAPEEEGDYPYLCTYPGHWAIMNGVMKVAK